MLLFADLTMGYLRNSISPLLITCGWVDGDGSDSHIPFFAVASHFTPTTALTLRPTTETIAGHLVGNKCYYVGIIYFIITII